MMNIKDRWVPLNEIAKHFGLSVQEVRRLGINRGLPLRQVSVATTSGALQSELIEWLKAQPRFGEPFVRNSGVSAFVETNEDPLFKSAGILHSPKLRAMSTIPKNFSTGNRTSQQTKGNARLYAVQNKH